MSGNDIFISVQVMKLFSPTSQHNCYFNDLLKPTVIALKSTKIIVIKIKVLFPPRIELGTFRVWGERDNHYTTETYERSYFLGISIRYFAVFVVEFALCSYVITNVCCRFDSCSSPCCNTLLQWKCILYNSFRGRLFERLWRWSCNGMNAVGEMLKMTEKFGENMLSLSVLNSKTHARENSLINTRSVWNTNDVCLNVNLAIRHIFLAAVKRAAHANVQARIRQPRFFHSVSPYPGSHANGAVDPTKLSVFSNPDN